MKKLCVIILLIFANLNPLASQWNVLPTGTSQPLYSVDYYTSNDIWVGSFNQFLKSTNAGANWTIYNPIKDGANANIMPVNVTSIKVTGANSAIKTGLYYIGNSECIYQTTNGGTNWNVVSVNNSVPLLRYLEAIDLSPSTAVVVGNNGRIGRSINSGTTWNFVTSGTSNLIRDVKFAAGDTVYACGDNVILKSVDAGLTWSIITSYTGEFNSISCNQNVIYIADRLTSQLLKSVNSGTSYSAINLPFTSEGVIHAISKDTLLASGQDGLYISKSGGQYWEKFILSSYQAINEFDFLTAAQGIAVGDSGFVIQTNNIWAAPSVPIGDFSIQGGSTNFCLGDSITFINSTAPLAGYTYQWKLDGVGFSTQYNTGVTLTSEGAHTITLAVTNANGTDTVSTSITVWGHSMSPLIVTASADSVCSNTYVGFTVLNSDIGTSYVLRNGSTVLGTAQNGNGGALLFQVPTALSATTTFNIRATRTNFCFTDSLVQYKTISLVSTPSPTTQCIPPLDYCQGSGITNVTFASINNSTTTLFNNYFDYSCCNHSVVTMGNTYSLSITAENSMGEFVKVWIDYDGNGLFDTPGEVVCSGFAQPTFTANITIDTTTFLNQKIRMRVASDAYASSLNNSCTSFNCGQIEDYSLTIEPAPVAPIASFTKTSIAGCTTSLSVTNTSWNATSYIWDFGDGSAAVTTMNATHVYTTSGTYTITLTAQNPTGTHVSTQTFSVVIPQVPVAAACTPLISPQSFSYVGLMSHLDLDNSPIYNPVSWSSSYKDSTCTPQLHLAEGTSHTLSFYMTNWSNAAKVGVWIDYNNDGSFTSAENLFGGVALTIPSSTWGMNQSFVVGTGVANTPLRMRVLLYDPQLFIMNGCGVSGTLSGGEMLDYSVYVDPPGPATADFTANYVTACTNQLVTFTNTSINASSAYWDFGDGTTSTQFSPSHPYTTAGVYSVKLIAINSLFSDTIIKTNYITINQSPASPTITANGNVLSCSTTGTAYQWYFNSAPVSGATSQNYTATQDGNYYVIVYNGSCYAYSATFAYYPPHANFTASPLNACPGINLNFQNLGSNGTSYTWHFGDGTTLTTPNVTYPFHSYAAGGVYTIKLIVCNTIGCDSMVKPNYINIYAAPPVPVVSQNGTQLYTNAVSPTYQWYKNGVLIPGATTSTYNPSQYDYYSVRVSNANGCYSYSANYPYFAVLAGFSADTTSYCGVTTASVEFTDTSVNATSWLWDFGDGNTSSLMNPIHTYNATGSYNVSLIVCNGPDCDTAVVNNYITISSIPFSVSLSPPDTSNICSGDSIQFALSGSGATSVTWYLNSTTITGATDTNYYALLDGVYNAVAVNSSGCISATDTSTLIVDYACVWPGDADNDYWVSNYDLLPVGLFYGTTGTARSVVSNAWQPNPAADWGVTYQSWGSDIKHADCNGDGIINDDDTLAINLNYSSIHNLAPPPVHEIDMRLADPPVFFTSSSPIYYAGDTVEIEIHAGDSAFPVNNFYGWAFDFTYNSASYADAGTVNLQYPSSWLGTPGTDAIKIGFIDEPSGIVYGAISRIDQTSRDGFGALAKLRFQASNSISSPVTMNFSFTGTWSIDSVENAVPLSPISYSIDIYPVTTGITQNIENSQIQVFPNPFNDLIQVTYSVMKKSDVTIELFDATGRKIKSVSKSIQTPGKYHHYFDINGDDLSEGIYIIKYTANDKVYFQKVIRMK